jgi:hypothetical protein
LSYSARFVCGAFDDVPLIAQIGMMKHMVEALVAINMAYLMTRRVSLYQSGVTYENPKSTPMGQEWRDIPEILRAKKGTCHELAAWRIAELRLFDGHPNAQPNVTAQVMPGTGLNMFHTAIIDPTTGDTEDPSKNLGMGNDEWRPFYY